MTKEQVFTLSDETQELLSGVEADVNIYFTREEADLMRGTGDTVTPMWISILNSVIIRVPLAYILVGLTRTPELPQGNFYMMPTSLLITWLIGACITFAMYKRGKWKEKAVINI